MSPDLVGLASLWALAVVTPGPNVLAIAHTTVGCGSLAGLATVGGIVSGTALWAIGSILGLGFLIAEAHAVAVIVKWIGVAYLAWTGIGMLRRAWRDMGALTLEEGTQGRGSTEAIGRSYRLGLLTNLSNPKTAVFFTSLLAVFIPAETGIAGRLEAIAIILSISLGWYGCLSLALGSPWARGLFRRMARAIEAVAGVLFLGFSVKLASS